MLNYKKIIGVVLIIFLVPIDQLSKYIIRAQGGFYICNTGLAFGLKFSHVLTILIPLILILLLIFTAGNSKFKALNPKQYQNLNVQNSKRFLISNFGNWNLFRISDLGFSALILIAAGAISNIIDRIYFGCVIDFIDLKIWPVFNLADIYITIGGIIMLLKLVDWKIENGLRKKK